VNARKYFAKNFPCFVAAKRPRFKKNQKSLLKVPKNIKIMFFGTCFVVQVFTWGKCIEYNLVNESGELAAEFASRSFSTK
jgi:hypothetical protein